MCRAIREKLRAACAANQKSPDKFSILTYLRKTDVRMNEVWLGLNKSTIDEWKILASKFIRHVMHKVDLSEVTTEDVAKIYPVIWKKYIEESGENDNIKLVVQ